MKPIVSTLKLPVRADPATLEALRATLQQYTESFNRVAAVGWAMDRLNGVELHKLTYQGERAQTTLPSQLVCSARVKATEAVKSARALLRKGRRASLPQSKRCAIRYDARSATIKLKSGTATLVTIEGRKSVKLLVPCFAKPKLGWKVCSSDLVLDPKGKVFLHVVVESLVPEVEITNRVVGVDLGVNRPAVTSEARFLGQRRWKEVEARSFRLKRRLQAKDTRSARRHLKRMSHRVNGFRKDCDHVLSKAIVRNLAPGDTVVLEDLTDIRDRMKGRRQVKRRLHSWSFHRLQTFLEYKALALGVNVAYVDPRYTSQKCSKCGHTDRGNRKSQSHFCCLACGFQLNADLNASRNIRQNHLASQAIGLIGGLPISQPIVSIVDEG